MPHARAMGMAIAFGSPTGRLDSGLVPDGGGSGTTGTATTTVIRRVRTCELRLIQSLAPLS